MSRIATEEDRKNAMTYGLCRQCGYPRTARVTVTVEVDGREYTDYELVCTRDLNHKAFG